MNDIWYLNIFIRDAYDYTSIANSLIAQRIIKGLDINNE